MRIHAVPPAVILGLVLTVGCSQTSEVSRTAPIAGTDTATTAPPARYMAVETKEGQVSLSLDGQLPPGWPEAFPVPPGAAPAGSGSLIGPEEGVAVAVYRGAGSAQESFEFYKMNPDLQVVNAASVGVDAALVGRVELTGAYDGSVTVGGNAGSDLIVVLLRLPPPEG